ncbi:tetratricopeptide repeat protein [Streptomyces sp. HD]|uniref:tetratricopeptide repeat protein n=1 Tax=Streptomyces sp. HD TaxID=3020892 RepID=UPI00233107C2|nr:tetratricopeptide repeat protein [Streptomyces sp. HD]MDC0771347.1 tetratricopeptide repeat protein [Streptomyces sp. HD]
MRSPVGEYESEKDFKLPSGLELENFLLRLGRPRMGTTRGPGNPELAPLKDFGTRLYESLFQGRLKFALDTSLKMVEYTGEGLRILLKLGSSAKISELPWEFLYDAEHSRFFAHSVRTPLVRYLKLDHRPHPVTVRAPLRVLVMIANPAGLPKLDVEREWDHVNAALADLQAAGQVSVERLESGTLPHLQKRLRAGGVHVFHFIGHGAYLKEWRDGVLFLEDRQGRERRTSGGEIGGLLHDNGVRLAVLNACEGGRGDDSDLFAGTAQSLVQRGLPAVVAMQFAITDTAAIEFAREFYDSIAGGHPLDAAVYEGRRAILNEASSFEWGTPVLYSRAPDGRIFDVAKEPTSFGAPTDRTEPEASHGRTTTATTPTAPSPSKARSGPGGAEDTRKPPVEDRPKPTGGTGDTGDTTPTDPNSPAGLVARAAAHRELGRPDEALRDLDRALTLAPDHVPALIDRGALRGQLGRYDDSLRDLDRALGLEPDNTGGLLERSATHWELTQYSLALRDLDRLLRLEPHNPDALHARGATYRELERNDEALRDLDRALQLKPDDAWTLIDRGMCHWNAGREDEAFLDLDRALQLEPNNVMALAVRGAAHRDLQNYDPALRDLSQLLTLEPDNAFALHARGAIWRELGRYDDALRDLDRALELEPDNAQALITRGTTYQDIGRNTAAVQDFNRALALDPDLTPTLPVEHGPAAMPVYEVEYDDDVSARPAQGPSFWERARYGEALRDLNQVAEQEANEAFLLRDRAASYLELGRYAEALNDLDRSLELDPDHAVAWAFRGLAYKALGEHSQALLDFDRSLGLDPTTDWVQKERTILLRMLSS